MVASHRRRRRNGGHQEVDQLLRIVTPGTAGRRPALGFTRSICVQRIAQAVRGSFRRRAEMGMAIATISPPSRAAQTTSRPGGYHSSGRRAVAGRPRQHGEISRATRPAAPAPARKTKKNMRAEGEAERSGAGERRDQGRPMAPAEPGDHDRQRRQIEQRDRQPNARGHRGEQQSRRGAGTDSDKGRTASSRAVPLRSSG